MTKHLKYLRYLLRHKWFVLLACWKRGIVWQGIIHDWSKFLPDEWFPYADYFYGIHASDGDAARALRITGYVHLRTKADAEKDFDVAWLKHQHRNPHHWQHWVLREDSGNTKILPMPLKYAIEMLCDWDGAGRAINGKCDTKEWYLKNREKIQIHEQTKAFVERELGINTNENQR